MRYTFFFKLPDKPYEFAEGNDKDEFIAKAEKAHKEHPTAVITVCDRQIDTMIWQANEFGPGGPCNICLTGMFD